jgi:rifampicin phosphotransferase
MSPYILPLSAPQANLETVGGKGMSLAKLANAGIPVPDGFHITTTAYKQFVAVNHLQDSIEHALQNVDISRPDTLEAASKRIQNLFSAAHIPEALAEVILVAYGDLPGGLPAVAVRSSATAEDLPEASFAGQQDTYLNITGPQQVLEAVRKCWASLWTARAIGYRARQGIQAEGVALAVVVQLLVNAEAAGILFTVNPISGVRNEMLINASWGLGEAVVGGAVTPDTLTVDKATGKVTRRETAKKLVMTVRTADGTEEQDVPAAMQEKPVLSDGQAAALVTISREIEALYQMPMDIEWAFSDEAFAILQARPITAIADAPLDWPLPNPKGFYIRASVVDLMPKPLSPLFISLWIPEQIKQMQPLGKKMTGSEPVLPLDYITSINAYAYASSSFSAKGYWWILTGMLPSYPKLLKNLVPMWRDDLYPSYKAYVDEKKNLQPAQLSDSELWTQAQDLVSNAAYYVCGLMFATMGASAGSEGLLTRVYNKMAKQNGDPDAAVLMMGWDNIAVRSEKSLFDIAAWVREDEMLSNFVQDTPTAALADHIAASGVPQGIETGVWAAFTSRFQSHMGEFGHIIFQLDFAEPLPLDHPEMMLENIKMYLRGEGSNPHERQQASEQNRIQTTEIMLNRLKGFKLWAFTKALNWGQSMSEVREDALASIGLAFPKLRELLLELGGRFTAAGAIQQANDIFWLEKDEISVCVSRLEKGQTLENHSKQVGKRKAFNERVSKITPPTMMPVKKRVMGVKTDMYVAYSGDDQSGNILKGEATSVGKVTAPACVLNGPEDFSNMRPGDVIVAGTTTPAWTPLFGMAAAVVADIGGPLSHGSIVAREFGIPAVMGTGVATKRIQSGQMITVDGTAGTVEILPES